MRTWPDVFLRIKESYASPSESTALGIIQRDIKTTKSAKYFRILGITFRCGLSLDETATANKAQMLKSAQQAREMLYLKQLPPERSTTTVGKSVLERADTKDVRNALEEYVATSESDNEIRVEE